MALHPKAVVLRGGSLRDPQKILAKAQKEADHGFGHVISVHCDVDCTENGPGLTIPELCAVYNRNGFDNFPHLTRIEACLRGTALKAISVATLPC